MQRSPKVRMPCFSPWQSGRCHPTPRGAAHKLRTVIKGALTARPIATASVSANVPAALVGIARTKMPIEPPPRSDAESGWIHGKWPSGAATASLPVATKATSARHPAEARWIFGSADLASGIGASDRDSTALYRIVVRSIRAPSSQEDVYSTLVTSTPRFWGGVAGGSPCLASDRSEER